LLLSGCPKLVLLDLDGRATFFEASYPAFCHELQLAAIVEFRRPANGELEPFPWNQRLIGSEQYTVTADVNRGANAFFRLADSTLTEYFVPNLSLDRETVG